MLYQRPERRRRGSVLIWFALFVWGILGVAALVIDLGLARVARSQMVTAADAGALEGLRLRDEIPPDLYADPNVQAALVTAVGPITPTDPAWIDRARRWYAGRLVSWQFDSSADTSSSAPQYGAGPLFSLTGGYALDDSSFRASQQLALGQPLFYVPQLQLNTDNAVSGDLVSGTIPRGFNGLGIENTDYTRNDFTPDTSQASSTTPGNAFLVRLRRTNDRQGLDNVGGVSSSAPPVPYLFGRGSLLNPTLKGDGITIRGTAIANARPVLSAGPVLVDPNNPPRYRLAGTTPFGLTVTFWNGLGTSVQNGKIDLTNGAITIGGTSAGNFTTPPTLTTVGQQFFVNGTVPVPANQDLYRYVPLYAMVETWGPKPRVVAFGHLQNVNWTPAGTNSTITFQKRVAPGSSILALAARNASPTLLPTWSQIASIPAGADVSKLFGALYDPTNPNYVPALLQAAALVNR